MSSLKTVVRPIDRRRALRRRDIKRQCRWIRKKSVLIRGTLVKNFTGTLRFRTAG